MRIFTVPLLLALATLAALLVALLDDGLLDSLAVVVLVMPLATVPWALWRAQRRRASEPSA